MRRKKRRKEKRRERDVRTRKEEKIRKKRKRIDGIGISKDFFRRRYAWRHEKLNIIKNYKLLPMTLCWHWENLNILKKIIDFSRCRYA